jgi:hypothetical protein
MVAICTFKTNILIVLSCMLIMENTYRDTREGLVEKLYEIPLEIPEGTMEMAEPPGY